MKHQTFSQKLHVRHNRISPQCIEISFEIDGALYPIYNEQLILHFCTLHTYLENHIIIWLFPNNKAASLQVNCKNIIIKQSVGSHDLSSSYYHFHYESKSYLILAKRNNGTIYCSTWTAHVRDSRKLMSLLLKLEMI